MTHTDDPVPFVIYPPVGDAKPNDFSTFDEESAALSPLFFTHAHKLMEFFILGR
jgi:2,3-bisphosphoglycerate-independent phosphoglycerate mutase